MLAMTIHKARKLRDGLIIAGFVTILLATVYEPLGYVGAAVMISGIIPDWLYNKCPHCGKHLGRNEGKFCQFCGGQIDNQI